MHHLGTTQSSTGHYTSNISACPRQFSDHILMTTYSVIIPLQRRHPLIDIVASVMIPMSNLIAEPSGVLPSRVLWLQKREFALLTDTILCLRPRSLPPLALPTPSVTPSFFDTPRYGAPCYVTPVSSTQLPRTCRFAVWRPFDFVNLGHLLIDDIDWISGLAWTPANFGSKKNPTGPSHPSTIFPYLLTIVGSRA